VVAPSKARVCGRSTSGTADSNHTEDMDVRPLCQLCGLCVGLITRSEVCVCLCVSNCV